MDSSAAANPPPPKTGTGEPVISDFIDITIKTIDSKNFQFQVENDVSAAAAVCLPFGCDISKFLMTNLTPCFPLTLDSN